MEMENSSLLRDLKLIIKYLQILKYNINDWSSEYVKTILTTNTTSRNKLLFWLLRSIGLSYTDHEQRSFNQSVINKIASDLSAIGICKPQDVNLIHGSANPEVQVIFWKTLLEMSIRLKTNPSSNLSHGLDELLYNLVNSPHYEDSLKDKNLNLLPKDLRLQFRISSKKQTDLNDRLRALNEKILKEKTKLSFEPLRDERNESTTELVQNIASLTAQSKAFVSVHEASLSPWCKLPATALKASPETGELAAQCFKELQQLQKDVVLSKSVESKYEQVMLKMNRLKQEQNLCAFSVLDSVVKP